MKKGTLAEKLAQKSFESAAVQKSWQVHMRAFGPILEPAFADNAKGRLELTAALNHISNRDLRKGMEKLQSLEGACATDADKAALLFCMGLCFEMANRKDDMIACYQEAGDYGHRFYLPYLKVAKSAHNDAVFEIAEENYTKAIQCLKDGDSDEQTSVILGSAYTNYASCLTMMRRYEEAEEALKRSVEILPEQTGRAATEAILEAARGNAARARDLVGQLAAQIPTLHEITKKMVDDILEKRHPHFSRIPLSEECMTSFWNWFEANEAALLKKLESKEYDAVFHMIQPKLKEVFPFLERDPEFGIEPQEDFYRITFADFFMVSLEQGYKQLVETAPRSLTVRWRFDTAR